MGTLVALTSEGRALPPLDSLRYPNHPFKRTRIYSSLNDQGFNSVALRLAGMSLHDVFRPEELTPDAHGVLHPDFGQALARARTLAARLEAADPVKITTMPLNGSVIRAEEVFRTRAAWLAERREEEVATDDLGVFSLYGTGLLAVVPGVDGEGRPAVHVLHREKDAEWHIQAAHIVVEMCELALTLPDPGLLWG
jgi:hypothetical protein